MIRASALLLVLLGLLLPAHAAPPAQRVAALQRGMNITNWLRFPARADPAAIGAYLSDAAIADLRHVGFTFVRLPFAPSFAATEAGRVLLIAQVRRLQRVGLAVVLVPSGNPWRLEQRPEDRAALVDTWRRLAPALRALDPDRTFPEVVNEPVFSGKASSWSMLQGEVLAALRAALPASTVILSGADWSSIDGLATMAPVADPNVIYTFHFYDPSELTSLAAYRPGLDRAALARLPFPVDDPAACAREAASPEPATQGLVAFVCAQHWDESAIAARIGRAAAWAARNRAVLVAGELGASARLNAPARLAWIKAVRGECERAGIGWALWGYDDVMGFDVPRPPPRRPTLDSDLLAALGLPRIKTPGHGPGE
ncbi:MAG TPA: cellulase family glycosylhydrolase [Acetobacteraceae bacterium]|nr:cellulase family glycosylhydrolase [Acetobacteraceae bacterium]